MSELETNIGELEYLKAAHYNESIDWYKLSSAVATFLAILTSLWLAYRDRLIRIVIDKRIGNDNDSIELIVTNVGRRDAVIVDVSVSSRCIGKPYNAKSIEIPDGKVKLEDGELHEFLLPALLTGWESHKKSLRGFDSLLVKLGIARLIARVKVSTGKVSRVLLR